MKDEFDLEEELKKDEDIYPNRDVLCGILFILLSSLFCLFSIGLPWWEVSGYRIDFLEKVSGNIRLIQFEMFYHPIFILFVIIFIIYINIFAFYIIKNRLKSLKPILMTTVILITLFYLFSIPIVYYSTNRFATFEACPYEFEELVFLSKLIYWLLYANIILIMCFAISGLLYAFKYIPRAIPYGICILSFILSIVILIIYFINQKENINHSLTGIGALIFSTLFLMASVILLKRYKWSEKMKEAVIFSYENKDYQIAADILMENKRYRVAGLVYLHKLKDLDKAIDIFEKNQNWDGARIFRKRILKYKVPNFQLDQFVKKDEVLVRNDKAKFGTLIILLVLFLLFVGLLSPQWYYIEYEENVEVLGIDVRFTLDGESGLFKWHITLWNDLTEETDHETGKNHYNGEVDEPADYAITILVILIVLGFILLITGFLTKVGILSGKANLIISAIFIIILLALLIGFPMLLQNAVKRSTYSLPEEIEYNVSQSYHLGWSYYLNIVTLILIVLSTPFFLKIKGSKRKYELAEGYFHAMNYQRSYKLLRKMGVKREKINEINENIENYHKRGARNVKMLEIECPGCSESFSIRAGEKEITCPHCGIEGEL